jgi:rRNA-processing protein FCF1
MERFKKKWILIDTNLLISISRYSELGFFDEFLRQLEELKIIPVIEQATLFEFRRGSRHKGDLEAKKNFLEILLGEEKNRYVLPSSTSKEILTNAEELAILYSNKNPNLSKQVSFVDCLVGAQLMKYKENLCLATLDNGDYPLFIFDRVKLITIDAQKEIINIGIYIFNEEKYTKCKDDFEKTK